MRLSFEDILLPKIAANHALICHFKEAGLFYLLVENRFAEQYNAAKSDNELKVKIRDWKELGCKCCNCI